MSTLTTADAAHVHVHQQGQPAVQGIASIRSATPMPVDPAQTNAADYWATVAEGHAPTPPAIRITVEPAELSVQRPSPPAAPGRVLTPSPTQRTVAPAAQQYVLLSPL